MWLPTIYQAFPNVCKFRAIPFFNKMQCIIVILTSPPQKNANTSTPFLPLPKNPPKNSTTPRQYRAARALPCGSRPKLLRGPAPPSSTSSAKTRRQGGKLSTRSSFRPGGWGWGMGFRCGEIQRVVDLTSRKCHAKWSQVLNPYFLVTK